jgi:hypothetical protein
VAAAERAAATGGQWWVGGWWQRGGGVRGYVRGGGCWARDVKQGRGVRARTWIRFKLTYNGPTIAIVS